MTFIHIYPDSMDPYEEEEGGLEKEAGREEGGDVSSLFTSCISETDILFHTGRGGGGDLSRWAGQRDSREAIKNKPGEKKQRVNRKLN